MPAMSGHDAQKLLLTFTEAGAYAGLSERHIRRLVKAGQLKAIRVEGTVRVPTSEVERFVSERLEVAQ